MKRTRSGRGPGSSIASSSGVFSKQVPLETHRRLFQVGLWQQNPALVSLLGLCPLLAVSTTVINALALGLVTLVTLVCSNLLVSGVRQWIPREIRLPVFVLLIASIVTLLELWLQAYRYELSQTLGIFVPLVVTNCVILGRAEALASRKPMGLALTDGMGMGLGFAAVLLLLGASRELVGFGTLLVGSDLLFGEAAQGWTVRIGGDYPGFLLAVLPPGAFIGLGFLIAVRNVFVAGSRSRSAR